MAKILVAMSGGVDSSLTAVLLHEQGHDVTGVTLHLWDVDEDISRESQCCSQDMVAGARRVCAQYDMPFYVFNYQREFRRNVVQYFIDGYASGVTPNPCLVCNRDIKFRFLLERAQALGFDYLATGHYARIAHDAASDSYTLLRATDQAKDQSYVLYMLSQAELSRIKFPLGGLPKATVRAMAQERGLVTANRPESQDICFVPDNDYRGFLRSEVPDVFTPGPIVDQEGDQLGQHRGLPEYTVGQRRGLGLTTREPVFVTELDIAHNTLVVGPATAAERQQCSLADLHFLDGPPPDEPFRCLVQLRIHGTATPAQVTPHPDGRGTIQFDTPQRAITPGQAAVFYHGDQVRGGGIIARTTHQGGTP